ncbi:DUF3024 domain-containing protein [Myroides marinus]|uniref:DUF3024 domain-containing protein n=1 Tax=Myroides marinus TaxID=703342 RepID=UPI0025785220|nr:DUF3024 domain-containing protein [Myroides marinus]MDM1533696.1 DUF3024 domain-containing protein [Myroides marinus]MDM1540660.1 DUF3024 domain-containing protein [Myroides marinus]
MGKIVDFDEERIKQFVESLRSDDPEIRKKLDNDFDKEGNTYILLEVRPDWMDPSIIRRHPFAKFKFIGTQKIWKLYWLRANGKWQLYDPLLEIKDLDQIFEEIKKDPYGCFFG